MIEEKNIQDKRCVLGQYFTDINICKKIVSNINFENADIIEPSFGSGNFLKAIKDINNHKIGIELDPEVYKEELKDENTDLYNMNFYDFVYKTDKKIIFIGNPPYRTPAYSLKTHKNYISKLTKKYGVTGIREEAVFFILHTFDIIFSNSINDCEIHYIIPMSILKNNSKFFTRFKCFLKQHCFFMNVITISGSEFENVAQDLICLSLKVYKNKLTNTQKTIKVDGVDIDLNEFLCLEQNDIIPFQKIFKETYLGSVPCESLLMSVEDEPKEHFQKRLISIIGNSNITTDELYDLLQYNGKFHLKIFDKDKQDQAIQDKLKIILSYVKNIQEKENIINEFKNLANYKEINSRNDKILYYFRCEKIKKNKNFVYELNPNPCKSFYFTGNPSSSSTDYFGFCNYDINRNVSPGANRTVPVDNLENNLTDFFKQWWSSNTNEPFSDIFEYIIYISKTKWYKQKKATNKRFYFGVPASFVPKKNRTTDYNIPSEQISFDCYETDKQCELKLEY